MAVKSYEYETKIESNKSEIHNIIVNNPPPRLFSSFPALLFLFLCAFFTQGISTLFRLLYLVLGTLFIILFTPGAVVKESVVIIPLFGVQLETHYQSGKILRNFVPMDKILKPMLLECVTPVTCYWRLPLMLRDEDKLTLVFRDVKPPLEMLISIWKALNFCTDPDDISESLPKSFNVPVYRVWKSDSAASSQTIV